MISKAIFGGGCFWCTEAMFQKIEGVVKVVSGYMGGETINPSYEDICSGTTGHAEVIEISFEDDIVSYEDLLRVFFGTHNPTTLNQQGADKGTQYRSVVFPYSDSQRKIVEQMIIDLNSNNIFDNKVVTQVQSLSVFYKAEQYHQDFYSRNNTHGYCQFVIFPKFQILSDIFPQLLVK